MNMQGTCERHSETGSHARAAGAGGPHALGKNIAESWQPRMESEIWLVRFQPRQGARLRLFCFPFAGAGASVYSAWRDLHSDIELIAAQLPGRENRFQEAPLRTIRAMVDGLAEAIRPYAHEPYAFFGHSMGAIIAFELAGRFRADGLRGPSHLFASARPAPHCPYRLRPIHNVPDDEFLEQIRRRWGNGIPPAILQDPEFLELFVPVLKADVAAIETYTHSRDGHLDCPITAFGGDEDQSVSRDDLCAWRLYTSGPFRQVMLPGGHFFLREQQHAVGQAVLEAMAAVLADSRG